MTMQCDQKRKLASLLSLKDVPKVTEWDNIKVGEIYHLPPLVYNERTDFIVLEKRDYTMKIRRLTDDYPQTMFKNDITTRFVVKTWHV